MALGRKVCTIPEREHDFESKILGLNFLNLHTAFREMIRMVRRTVGFRAITSCFETN